MTLRRGQRVPMIRVPAEGETIFMLERKTVPVRYSGKD